MIHSLCFNNWSVYVVIFTVYFLNNINFLQETLTGFKWMGNKTAELKKEGKSVIFCFEEAIGFMCYMSVLDKDGISAAIRVAELVAYLDKKGMSLMDKLQELYST